MTPARPRTLLSMASVAVAFAAADTYVAARRKADPRAVEEAEELLKLEQDASKPIPAADAKK